MQPPDIDQDKSPEPNQPEWVNTHLQRAKVLKAYAEILQKLDWFFLLIFAIVMIVVFIILFTVLDLKTEAQLLMSLAASLTTALFVKRKSNKNSDE